jgi:hypothetical protein
MDGPLQPWIDQTWRLGEIGLDVHLKVLFRQRTAITHLPNTIIKTVV